MEEKKLDKYEYGSGPAFQNFEERPPKRGGAFFAIVVTLLILLLAGMIALLVYEKSRYSAAQAAATPTPAPTAAVSPTPDQSGEPAAPAPTAPATPAVQREMPQLDGIAPIIPGTGGNPIPDIFDAVSPSVVGVINYVEMPVGDKEMLTVYGTGTGFLVSSEGYVLTNAHVVEGAQVVTVKLADGKEIDAEIVGSDTETDVAVLRVDARDLKPLKCGDSDDVRVGEYVLAIGNPLDSDRLVNTLTFGIISAREREITIDNYTNTYLQIDAAINYGNSGGPLLNMKGEVIGINSAKSFTAGYDSFGNPVAAEGIGFALPINHVLKIMETLVTEGSVKRPGIGIMVTTVTKVMSEQDGIPVGALVENVVKGGPAQRAGLAAGDVIVEANGQALADHYQLIDIVTAANIGDVVTVRVYRDGKYLELAIVIGNKTDMNFSEMD